MEYLIGSLLTIFTMVIFSRNIRRVHSQGIPNTVKYSQSYTHTLLMPLMPYLVPGGTRKDTQASKHLKKTQVRVIFTEEEAYWIANSKLYVAKLIDGFVDEASTTVVDTMTMDKVQLDKMIFIVEKLTEGLANDSSSSGN